MTGTMSIAAVLDAYRSLAEDIRATDTNDAAMKALTSACLRLVPDAAAAAVTSVNKDGYQTLAPTGDLAVDVDRIQFDVGSGPCIDAAEQQTVFQTDDLRSDERWPEFGRRAAEETGVLSMLAFRLFLEDDEQPAALNLYSTKPEAFDEIAQMTGLAAATYGAELITSRRRHIEVAQLKQAVRTNRDIGAAIGVVMARYNATRDQAFDLLRMASQNSHRKLVDVAADVLDTGIVELR